MNTIATKKITSIRLDKNLFEHISKIAKKQNRSINNYIETILFDATGFQEPNNKTVAAIEEVRK